MKSKDDKRHNKDRVKSSYIMIRTTFFFFFFFLLNLRVREKNREQWNLRNKGPHLYKVANEVDSLYSSSQPPRANLR